MNDAKIAGPRPNATAVAITASRYSMEMLARFTWPRTSPMNRLTTATAASAVAYPSSLRGERPRGHTAEKRSNAWLT
jgi:hypothetical protein